MLDNTSVGACTSYAACGFAFYIPSFEDIHFTTMGAIILLIARLIKDVPDAYDSVMKRIADRKERKKQNDQGNR
jgi:hypothetical protein